MPVDKGIFASWGFKCCNLGQVKLSELQFYLQDTGNMPKRIYENRVCPMVPGIRVDSASWLQLSLYRRCAEDVEGLYHSRVGDYIE